MKEFVGALTDITGSIDSFMYTYVLVFMLVGAGIYFTIKTRGVQFRYLKEMFTVLTEHKHVGGEKSVSSFQALMVSTASRVGTGNIAGIAFAIAAGGPGAVFWMWLMAFIGGASAFIESTLAQMFKVRGDKGEFRGGPAYYIEQALGKRWLAVVFSISLIICFAYGFNGLQAYNMSSSLDVYIPNFSETDGPLALGIILAVFSAFVIFGGAARISFMTSIIVPIMALAYIGLSLIITIMNIGALPEVFQLIFSSAFDVQSIFGGFAGSVIVIGVKRGLFSNEAGMGSAPNASAAASVSHPCKQGLAQTLSVFIDTLLICTCSAFMILIYLVQADPADVVGLTGMPLVQQAINNSLGPIGIHFITFAIFAFAFSSLIGNYFYAESNIRFIKDSPLLLLVFRITCLLAIFIGAQSEFELAWNIADIVMGVMAFINIIAIVLLGKYALICFKDYETQRAEGKDPVFLADRIPELPRTECWHMSPDILASEDARLEQSGEAADIGLHLGD